MPALLAFAPEQRARKGAQKQGAVMTKADRDAIDAAMVILETAADQNLPPYEAANVKAVIGSTLGRLLKDINCIADAAATTGLK